MVQNRMAANTSVFPEQQTNGVSIDNHEQCEPYGKQTYSYGDDRPGVTAIGSQQERAALLSVAAFRG